MRPAVLILGAGSGPGGGTDLRLLVEFVAAVSVVLAAIGSAWVTSRAGKQATKTTTAVEAAAVEVTREDRLIQNLEIRLARVEEEAEECRQRDAERDKREAEYRERIRELEDRNADNRRRMRALADLVRDVRRKWETDRGVMELQRKYVRELLGYVRRRGHGADMPQPPMGLPIEEPSEDV